MRKLLSVLLLLLICLTMISLPSFAETTTVGKYTDSLDIAVALGLLNGTATERENSGIARGEFFDAIVKLCGAENMGGESYPFSDVKEDDSYYNAVCSLYSLGYVKGYGDGTVRPKENITVGDAVRLLCYVCGWKEAIENGCKVSYAARSSDICNYSEAESPALLSVGKAAQLLVNTGDSMAVEISGYDGENADYTASGSSVFEKNMYLTKMSGILTANDMACLSQKGYLSEGMVTIGDKQLFEGSSDAGILLGCCVTVYYYNDRSESPDTIIYAYADEKDNDILEIKGGDCEGFSGGSLKYYDGKNLKSVSLKLSNLNLIYNNQFSLSPQAEDFDISGGYVRLIDADRSGGYETAVILDYETCVVNSVNSADEQIYGKDGMVVDCKKPERFEFKDSAGADAYLIELSEWDVLSVAKSKDGSVVSIEYAMGEVNGIFTAYEAGDPAYIYIDEASYEVSDYCITNYAAQLSEIGETVSLGLDTDGRVACIRMIAAQEKLYGYVMAWGETKKGLKTGVDVKLINEKNEVITASLAEKVIVNGDKWITKEKSQQLTGIGRDMIVYSMNKDGQICEIDTSYTLTIDGVVSSGTQESEESLCLYYDCFSLTASTGEYTQHNTTGCKPVYRSASKSFITVKNEDFNALYGNTLAINGQTKVFEVPRSSSWANDNDYVVRPISSVFSNDGEYYFRAYKSDARAIAADAMIVYIDEVNTDRLLTRDAKMSVITEPIRGVMDEDGVWTYEVSVFHEGEFRSYLTEDSSVIDDVKMLNGQSYTPGVGDAVKLSMTFDGKIARCALVYSQKLDKLEVTEGKSVLTSGGTLVTSAFRVQLANVYEYYQDHIKITQTPLLANTTYTPSTLALETKTISSAGLLVYDSETKRVTGGTVADIVGFVNSGKSMCSRILVQDRIGNAQVMVIYR